MSNYIIASDHSEALAHHGIKGQKWGVRRYQNADGSLTREGIKRYSLAKKLANDQLPTDIKYNKARSKYEKRMDRLSEKYMPKEDEEWFDYNDRGEKVDSKKAAKWMKIAKRENNKFNKKEEKLFSKKDKARDEAYKKVFLNDDLKKDVNAAKNIKKRIKALVNSDDEKNYVKAKKLEKAYDDKITEIGKKAFGQYANDKLENSYFSEEYKDYAEFGKYRIDSIISWREDLFK